MNLRHVTHEMNDALQLHFSPPWHTMTKAGLTMYLYRQKYHQRFFAGGLIAVDPELRGEVRIDHLKAMAGIFFLFFPAGKGHEIHLT